MSCLPACRKRTHPDCSNLLTRSSLFTPLPETSSAAKLLRCRPNGAKRPSSVLGCCHVLLFPRQEVAIVCPVNLRVAVRKSIGSHPPAIRRLPGILLADDDDTLRIGQTVDGPLIHYVVIVGNQAILGRARG